MAMAQDIMEERLQTKSRANLKEIHSELATARGIDREAVLNTAKHARDDYGKLKSEPHTKGNPFSLMGTNNLPDMSERENMVRLKPRLEHVGFSKLLGR